MHGPPGRIRRYARPLCTNLNRGAHHVSWCSRMVLTAADPAVEQECRRSMRYLHSVSIEVRRG